MYTLALTSCQLCRGQKRRVGGGREESDGGGGERDREGEGERDREGEEEGERGRGRACVRELLNKAICPCQIGQSV